MMKTKCAIFKNDANLVSPADMQQQFPDIRAASLADLNSEPWPAWLRLHGVSLLLEGARFYGPNIFGVEELLEIYAIDGPIPETMFRMAFSPVAVFQMDNADVSQFSHERTQADLYLRKEAAEEVSQSEYQSLLSQPLLTPDDVAEINQQIQYVQIGRSVLMKLGMRHVGNLKVLLNTGW